MARSATPTASQASSARARRRVAASTCPAWSGATSRVAGVASSVRSPSRRVASMVERAVTTSPWAARSTRKSASCASPPGATPSEAWAATTAPAAMPASGTRVLVPVSVQASPSRLAPQALAPASAMVRGPSGSATARVAERSPAAIASSSAGSAAAARAGWASATVANSGPGYRARPASSNTTASSTRSPPTPPRSAGSDRARQPSSARRGREAGSQPGSPSASSATRSRGQLPASRSRTERRSSSCSSEKAKSMGVLPYRNGRWAAAALCAGFPRRSSVQPARGYGPPLYTVRPGCGGGPGPYTVRPTRGSGPPRSSAAAGQAEDALGDDVAQHLGGAGLDGVAPAAEMLVLPVAAPGAVGPVELGRRPEQLERQLGEPLVRLRPVQLGHRPLGAGDAGPHQAGEGAVVGVAQALQVDPEAGDALAHQRVVGRPAAGGVLGAGELDELAQGDLHPHGEREAEGAALVQQGGHGHRPAAVRSEEHTSELQSLGHLV